MESGIRPDLLAELHGSIAQSETVATVANADIPAVTAVNDSVPAGSDGGGGTSTVTEVTNPVTVTVLSPTDLIRSETVPLETQPSPLPEDTYRSSIGGGRSG
jgi:hypothetical protein